MNIDENRPVSMVPRLIFASRWLQLPLYLGLIVAQIVYVFLFVEELVHLVEMLWNPGAIDSTVQRLGIAER
ncbi:MAG: YqhA family protein, partial [Quisquiliibacterium sp.]